MGERLVRNEEVRGSIPLSSTNPAAERPANTDLTYAPHLRCIVARPRPAQIQPTQPGLRRLIQ
jgi:hypothetical protein